MEKVFYLGYYDVSENEKDCRNYVLAATNKMTYICSALNKSGKFVEIISAAGTKNRNCCAGTYQKIQQGLNLKLFFSLGRKNKLWNVIGRFLIKLQLCFYILKNIKFGQTVLVYHSLGYSRIVKLLKKIIGFKLVLEVEEIYSDVSGNDKTRKMEYDIFNKADAFIFPTELLDKKINVNHKPSAIIYGTYQVENARSPEFSNRILQQDEEGMIHVLYAGTFDPRKGGAEAAAKAAEYLPSNYHIHILGFGSDEDTKKMKETIKEIAKRTKAKLTYDGLLSGEDYIKFVQGCQIGLSTQNPNAAFNATSFPSKVLSYLANGLRVVSIRIRVLETSAISDLLYYYDEQTPEAIAETVLNIDLTETYDSREVIAELDVNFTKKLGELINAL